MIRSARHRKTSSGTVPVVLTIAGSDNSGGAGIQADLKTFTALGVYGTSAITCVVAEHPGRVLNITAIPPRRVTDQIQLVLEAFPVAAIKTGLLFSAGVIAAIEQSIAPALRKGVPLVIDPVMVSSTGTLLLKKRAVAALLQLMKRATLVTPNRGEAAALLGWEITDEQDAGEVASELVRRLQGPSVLLKGGHFGTDRAVDWLCLPDGTQRHYSAKRINGIDPHGTGCTYSAAIAAGLAQGMPLPEAVAAGKRFITRALANRLKIGRYELLNHLS